MALSPPIELLDLPAEGELVTRVTRMEEDQAFIKPSRAPQGVTVQVIRLHVPATDKPTAPLWWDVTATTLHPSLRVQIPAAIADQRWVRIRKFGVAPRARFSFEVFPVGQGGPAFVGLRR